MHFTSIEHRAVVTDTDDGERLVDSSIEIALADDSLTDVCHICVNISLK